MTKRESVAMPHVRFDRWSLRYKGFELATIECLAYFKLTTCRREPVNVELCPLNEHAKKIVAQLAEESDGL